MRKFGSLEAWRLGLLGGAPPHTPSVEVWKLGSLEAWLATSFHEDPKAAQEIQEMQEMQERAADEGTVHWGMPATRQGHADGGFACRPAGA